MSGTFTRRAVAVFAAAWALVLSGPKVMAMCDQFSPPPVTDDPDDGFADTNSDGIDGMACGPIFVSPTGDDRSLGTIDAPMKTLGAAILAAKWYSPPRSVYVSSNGAYNETVVFVDGVNVFGGYDHTLTWARGNTPAQVNGGVVGAWAVDLTTTLTLDRLAISAADQTAPGALSIGLVAETNSAGMSLESCAIHGGDVLPGTSGGNGAGGATGGNAGAGQPGSCDDFVLATGGAGGTSAAGNIGGAGGSGGSEGDNNGALGGFGLGPAGGGGGAGGVGGMVGQPGSNGAPGGSGANGANGAGGATFYAVGQDGQDGVDGSGGGGGGGGGGQGGVFVNDGTGNGGGGGGGGGQGGKGGAGGGAGGSSYGVLAVATNINATNGEIGAAAGANGGAGGMGGAGAAGGLGASGAANCTAEVGRGGNGANGGSGGNGGHGGGGAGGNSIAVLREAGSSFNGIGTLLSAGAAGVGGPSPGNPGVSGTSSSDFAWGGITSYPALGAPTAVYALVVTDQDVDAAPVTPLVADVGGFAYTFTVISPAGHGSAGVMGNQLTYSPAPGYVGSDWFGIRATRVGPGTSVDGYAVVEVLPPVCNGPKTLDFNCDSVEDGLDIQIFVDRLLGN